MKLVFLGPPGVGKGTYSEFVKKEYHIPHISTGDLLRNEIANKTPDGIIAQSYMDKGNLAPVELVTRIMKRRLDKPDCKNGFILDGYPRSVEQAELLHKENIHIDKVLYFTASQKTILERLSGRRTCEKCGAIFHVKNSPPKKEGICDKCGAKIVQRADETEEAVKQRLIVYESTTKPVADFFKKKEILVQINTEKPLPEIYSEIKTILDKFSK